MRVLLPATFLLLAPQQALPQGPFGVSDRCIFTSGCVGVWVQSVGYRYRLDHPTVGGRNYFALEVGRFETTDSGQTGTGLTAVATVDDAGEANLGLLARHRFNSVGVGLDLGIGAMVFDSRGLIGGPIAQIRAKIWRGLGVDFGLDTIRYDEDTEATWHCGLNMERVSEFISLPHVLGFVAMAVYTTIRDGS